MTRGPATITSSIGPYSVHLARELALHAEAQAVVDHAVTVDGGMVAVSLHDEREEVIEVETTWIL